MTDITARWERDPDNEPDGPVGVYGCSDRFAIAFNGNKAYLEFTDMATARRVAHAILDADRHPTEAKPLARVEIVDVAAHWRELHGDRAEEMLPEFARPLEEHSYQFRGNDPTRGADFQPTYGTGYTAAHIIASIEQDRELKAKGL